MLSSIHPFGERSRHSRWSITATAYVVGSTAGGAAMGGVLGVVSGVVRAVLDGPVALGILAAACVWGVCADTGRAPTPSWHRQVNEVWLTTYRGWVYGAGFGAQLGVGVITIVTTAAVWLTWLSAVLSGAWWRGLLIGATFGLARSVLIFSTARVHGPDALRRLHRRIAAQARPVHRLTVALTAVAALVALTGVGVA